MNCATWFNGCNTCQVFNGQLRECTENRCKLYNRPYCKQKIDLKYQNDTDVTIDTCGKWFDGCNTCSVKNEETEKCTEQFCDEYAKPFCLKKPDEIKVEKPKAPLGCTLWFDGCNTCKVKPNGRMGGCTKKSCDNDEEPECL